MRRRKDPIPPGAEIYWGHRASFAVLGWMLTLPALFLAAIVWNDRRSGTGDWIAVALFFLFTAGLWLVIAGLMRSYMLIDGDRVEIRVFSGKVIRFTLGEITGYLFVLFRCGRFHHAAVLFGDEIMSKAHLSFEIIEILKEHGLVPGHILASSHDAESSPVVLAIGSSAFVYNLVKCIEFILCDLHGGDSAAVR